MPKHIRLIVFALLLTVVSGCFPVLVPAGAGHHEGRGNGGDHDRHGDHGDRD